MLVETANPSRERPMVGTARKRARRRSIGVMALERRVMYDAAAGAAVGTAVLDPTHTTDATTTTTATSSAAAPLATDASHTTDASTTQSNTAVSGLPPLAWAAGAPTPRPTAHPLGLIDPPFAPYPTLP